MSKQSSAANLNAVNGSPAHKLASDRSQQSKSACSPQKHSKQTAKAVQSPQHTASQRVPNSDGRTSHKAAAKHKKHNTTVKQPLAAKSCVSDSEYIESSQAAVKLLHHRVAAPQSPKTHFTRGLNDEIHSMHNRQTDAKRIQSHYSETSDESEDPVHERNKHAPRLRPYNAGGICDSSAQTSSQNNGRLLYAFLELHKCDKPSQALQQPDTNMFVRDSSHERSSQDNNCAASTRISDAVRHNAQAVSSNGSVSAVSDVV